MDDGLQRKIEELNQCIPSGIVQHHGAVRPVLAARKKLENCPTLSAIPKRGELGKFLGSAEPNVLEGFLIIQWLTVLQIVLDLSLDNQIRVS